MTIEITIRFADSRTSQKEFFDGLLAGYDCDAVIRGRVNGGFYFHTDESAGAFFMWLEEENFVMADFEHIHVEPK